MSVARWTLEQLNPAMRKQAERQLGLRPPDQAPERASKYNAVRTELDGRTFASKSEAGRWLELRAEEMAGLISDLRCQVRFGLTVKGEKICDYDADFVYARAGKRVVEDVKGYNKGAVFQLFTVKQRLMRLCHGIDVVVIRRLAKGSTGSMAT